MAGILDLMGYIQDQSEKGRQAGLSRLVGKAYGAAPDQQQQILSTVAQRGAPDMAINADKAFGEQQDNVHLQMAKRAAEVVALYQSNPQMAQQVYQNGLLPIARRAGVPNAPMQLDASLIPGLEKLASAANAGGTPAEIQTFNTLTQGMSPKDIANARRVKLGLDSRAPVVQPGQYDSSRGAFVSNPFYGGTRQQAPAQQMPQRMTDEQIVAMANQMAQSGMPSAQIEQWMRQQQGMPDMQPAPQQAPQSRAIPVEGLPDRPQAPKDTYSPLSSDEVQALGLPPGTFAQRNMATGEVKVGPAGGDNASSATPAGDMTKSGAAYLQSLNGQDAAQVKALAEGRMSFPTGTALKSPYWQKMLASVAQYDPSFDAVNYASRSATRKDYTSGKSAANIRALNTLAGHIAGLQVAVNELGGSKNPIMNSIHNLYIEQTGDPRLAKLRAAKTAVANELTTVFRGSSGAEADVQGWLKQLDEAQSPEQLNAVIREVGGLVESRIKAVQESYTQGMGNSQDGRAFVTPQNQRFFDQLQGRQSGAAKPSSDLDALLSKYGAH